MKIPQREERREEEEERKRVGGVRRGKVEPLEERLKGGGEGEEGEGREIHLDETK